MKKILLLLLTVAMIATMFIGCAKKTGFGSTSADTNGNGLRDDVELKIMEAYYNGLFDKSGFGKFDPDGFEIAYFGIYGGAIAVNIRLKKSFYLSKTSHENIAGIDFVYSDSGDGITVWYNGKLFRMKELYELNVLKKEDIEKIHEERELFKERNRT